MAARPKPQTVTFFLDGQEIVAHEGETILQAAKRHGIAIPHLCYQEGMRPDGNCRACVVEIEGERVLAPSCWRKPTEGMKVKLRTPRVEKSQKLVLELLLCDMPGQGRSPYRPDSELDFWAEKLGLKEPRFPERKQWAPDLSHPAIAVNLDACIQCTRCLRGCREEQGNDVIGYAFRGWQAKIVFDFDDPLGESTCVACGECVQACPTGALMPAGEVGKVEVEKRVDSVCPYCGVGCLLTYHVKGNRVLYVTGRSEGPSNRGRLCVKGRYGFDYVQSPERLKVPLIRREDAPKTPALIAPSEIPKFFREATWEEALDRAARGLLEIKEKYGPKALAGFGSAKGSNEEAYLFQKLVRVGFGSHNVDHCTRLCHASSVAALLECIGSGAVSNPFRDVLHADVAIVIGAKPTENHPVAATFIKNAAERGTTLITIDPIRHDLFRYAHYPLQIYPDSDVALLNAMLYTIVEEQLYNQRFIERWTEGFEALKRHLLEKNYSPERMAPVCGVPAETIREVARLYATAKSAMILWGMGVSQHTHGTDNTRCLIALSLLCGQIGRRGTGLHPLRGQNNVQGASDAGLIPMVFPDYQRVDDPQARAFFEEFWGAKLDPEPGLTVVEIMHAIERGEIRGMYIMGENPAMSDPNLAHARKALSMLDHLVVQEIFFTETCSYADVILPASAALEKTGTFTNTDRQVQLGRQALDPPGEAKQDLWIIQEIARRMGLPWNYSGPAEVFEEMRQAMPSIRGISWERLEREHAVTYPCTSPDDPGQEVIFQEGFPTPSGKGKLVPVDFSRAAELPDDSYPLVFITGRLLEHWHTGAMTRRATVLNTLQPEPFVALHPETLAELGLADGDLALIESRRGRIKARLCADLGVPRKSCFMAFCYREAAANLLTNEALDPVAKIPEFKFCAVRVRPLEQA